MKLHRFFIENLSAQGGPQPKADGHRVQASGWKVNGGQIAISDEKTIQQIRRVLRLKVGDKIIILNDLRKEFLVEIEELGEVLRGKILESKENKNDPELKIRLYQSFCKKDKFEWILQKGTEVGISEFVPVIADRSEKFGLNIERANKILKEAAEQSERGFVPKLHEVMRFKDAIKDKEALTQGRSSDRIVGREKLFLDRSGESIKSYTLRPTLYELNIFVGPEGGWTDEELELAKQSGAKIISTGALVLRTETAGLIAAAIILSK